MKVEEATSWLEKISGRIEVEQLNPSWLIFAEGFQFGGSFQLAAAAVLDRWLRRLRCFWHCRCCLSSSWPSAWILPAPFCTARSAWAAAASTFYCLKFRTMRQDAEADTGATWAADDDPRITRVGKFSAPLPAG